MQCAGDLRSLSLDSGSVGSANFSLQRSVATLISAKCSLSADSLSDSSLSNGSDRPDGFRAEVDGAVVGTGFGENMNPEAEEDDDAADVDDDDKRAEVDTVPECKVDELLNTGLAGKIRPPSAFSITRFIVSMSSTGGPPIEQFLDGCECV